MGKEVQSSKGFFMTAAALLALAMVASYFGDSTGQAVYRSSRTDRGLFIPDTQPQDRGPSTTSATESDKNTLASQQRISSTNNNFGCETSWEKLCGFFPRAIPSSPQLTEANAVIAANAACEADKEKELANIVSCAADAKNDCIAPCQLSDPINTYFALRPCTIFLCSSITAGQGVYKVCTSKYDKNGKRTEGDTDCSYIPISSSPPNFGPGYICYSSDGGKVDKYTCA